MNLKDIDYFDNIIYKIKWLVNWYNNVHFESKQFRIFLANGERILYKCMKNKVPHLLGVNTDFLALSQKFKSTSSYDILIEFLNNPFSIRQKIINGEIDFNKVFSKHIDQKLLHFKSNISINQDNILFVVKYDAKVTYNQGKDKRNCDYILFKKLDDGEFLEMDLKLNDKYAVPVSSRVYNDEYEAQDSMKEVLTNQDTTIVGSIIFENEFIYSNKKLYISEKDKIFRLQYLKNLKDKFNCHVDVVGDCEYYYGKNYDNRNIGKNNYDILDTVIQSVLEGKIIDEKSLQVKFSELTNQQRNLIDVLNDQIIFGNNKLDSNQESYSTLRKKCEKLESVKKELEDNNKQLTDKNNELIEQVGNLTKENETHKQFVKQIIKTVKDYESEE
jgi:hypothetical protein